MSYKKGMKKLVDMSVYGAGAMQASTLLTTNKANPANAIPGMVGVGVAGAVANASFNLASKGYKKKRMRRR